MSTIFENGVLPSWKTGKKKFLHLYALDFVIWSFKMVAGLLRHPVNLINYLPMTANIGISSLYITLNSSVMPLFSFQNWCKNINDFFRFLSQYTYISMWYGLDISDTVINCDISYITRIIATFGIKSMKGSIAHVPTLKSASTRKGA